MRTSHRRSTPSCAAWAGGSGRSGSDRAVLARARWWWSAWLLVQGCAVAQPVGSDCVDEEVCEQARESARARGGGGPVNGAPPIDQPPRVRSGLIQRVDVLFVVSDTPAMQAVENSLSAAVPVLVEGLATGDSDGGGAPNFRAVTDVHFGVISARMEAMNDGASGCGGSADGKLANIGCLTPAAPFASMQGRATAMSAANDLSCLVRLGAAGCEPPQPLEAMLKALWPSDPSDPLYGQLTFVDGSQQGVPGNAGFLRDDSLIVVIVVSGSDDCSLRGPIALDATAQDVWLHNCIWPPDPRFDIARYVDGLRALRTGAEDLVMFFALTGAPALAVDRTALSAASLEQDDQREAFYDRLLRSLQSNAVNDRGTPNTEDDLPFPICSTASGDVYPAPRLVELARAFGPNGLVQSVCEPDLGVGMRVILRSIGRRLGPAGI